MEIIDLFLRSCYIIQDDQYKVTFVGRYQDNLTRWRWRAFCWWCLPPRWQGRASSRRGARTRELQPTTCLKYKIMKMQIKNRHNFHEEPEPVEMSSKLTTSGAMNSGVPARFWTWILSVLRKQDLSIFWVVREVRSFLNCTNSSVPKRNSSSLYGLEREAVLCQSRRSWCLLFPPVPCTCVDISILFYFLLFFTLCSLIFFFFILCSLISSFLHYVLLLRYESSTLIP